MFEQCYYKQLNSAALCLRILVGVTTHDCESIPPLIGKCLQQDVALVAASIPLDIRNFKAELTGLESMDGWQYLESTIYDMGSLHAVHTLSSRSLLFVTLDLPTKVPPPLFLSIRVCCAPVLPFLLLVISCRV